MPRLQSYSVSSPFPVSAWWCVGEMKTDIVNKSYVHARQTRFSKGANSPGLLRGGTRRMIFPTCFQVLLVNNKKMIKFKVTDEIWLSSSTAVDMGNGNWQRARPELLSPNLAEWFRHTILRQHFSWGQPYCIVCGKSVVSPSPTHVTK